MGTHLDNSFRQMEEAAYEERERLYKHHVDDDNWEYRYYKEINEKYYKEINEKNKPWWEK